jgi:hypothetical protein
VEYNGERMSLTHKEALEWVAWYAARTIGRGVPKAQVSSATRLLCDFLASGGQFLGDLDRVVCPACEGRKHTGISLTQGGPPEPCSTCDGDGWIEAEPQEVAQ